MPQMPDTVPMPGSPNRAQFPSPAPADGHGLEAEVARLRAALDWNHLRLRELDHRAMSGPAALASLIGDDVRTARDPVLRTALEHVRHRLEGLCQAQDLLRLGSQSGETDILAALRKLAAALSQAHDAAGRGVAVAVRGLPIRLPAEEAGLLLMFGNEALSNALRFAFRDRAGGGRVEVTVRTVDGAPEVAIQDDGVGISDRTLRTGGSGIWLIRALAERLRADLRIERGNGTRVVVILPKAVPPRGPR